MHFRSTFCSGRITVKWNLPKKRDKEKPRLKLLTLKTLQGSSMICLECKHDMQRISCPFLKFVSFMLYIGLYFCFYCQHHFLFSVPFCVAAGGALTSYKQFRVYKTKNNKQFQRIINSSVCAVSFRLPSVFRTPWAAQRIQTEVHHETRFNPTCKLSQ